MRRYGSGLKVGIGLVAVVMLVAASAVYGLTEMRLRKHYDIVLATAVVTPEAQLVERGRHIAVTRGCTDCHAADAGGQVFIDDPGVALISASNLTGGNGGIAARYTESDWERAIRHGVGPGGRALAVMPSMEYFGFSDDDVAALIAYFRSVPPVDRELPARSVGPIGRVLLTAGMLPPLAAEIIDHDAPRPESPPEGPTLEYGRYLAAICTGCHGESFTGGNMGPPGAPPGPNLTPDPASGIGTWVEADFFRALREGRRPDGSEIRIEYMPWSATAQMTDAELRALWLYFNSLAPVSTGAG
jgi:cytochrome c553